MVGLLLALLMGQEMTRRRRFMIYSADTLVHTNGNSFGKQLLKHPSKNLEAT